MEYGRLQIWPGIITVILCGRFHEWFEHSRESNFSFLRPSWPTAVCLPCNAWCVAWKVSVYCLCFEMFENPSFWDWIWCDLGHLPTNCPDEQLPPLVKLPPMTREFLGLVDSLCKVATLDTYFGNFLNKCFSPFPRTLSTTGSLRNRSFATGTTSCPTWTGESKSLWPNPPFSLPFTPPPSPWQNPHMTPSFFSFISFSIETTPAHNAFFGQIHQEVLAKIWTHFVRVVQVFSSFAFSIMYFHLEHQWFSDNWINIQHKIDDQSI